MIEVSDTGAGMSREVMAHIFEPFFTTKARGAGTGLGLSMVFGFMKQSSGHVTVDSVVGKGTVFRLYLPRSVAAAAVGEARTPASALVGGAGETVLAVEDNPALRRVVERQLKELGYPVIEAAQPPAALAILETEAGDLMFSDVV